MKSPLVSIIMPCFRALETVERSVDSILNQDYENWELWILIDGDHDCYQLLNDKYSSTPRIHIVFSKINRGVSRMRNIGIFLSKGKYIAFCDSDDWWIKNKLSLQIEQLEVNNADLICSSFEYYYPQSNKYRKVKTNETINYYNLLKSNVIPFSTAVLKKDTIKFHYFIELPKGLIHEDYYFWLSLFKSNSVKAIYLNKYTTYISQQPVSRSSNKFKAIYSQYYILKNVAHVNTIYAFFLLVNYMLFGILKRLGRSD